MMLTQIVKQIFFELFGLFVASEATQANLLLYALLEDVSQFVSGDRKSVV